MADMEQFEWKPNISKQKKDEGKRRKLEVQRRMIYSIISFKYLKNYNAKFPLIPKGRRP